MKFIITLILTGAMALPAMAQKSRIVTEEVKVSGVCIMCKERIEHAALIKGVKNAEWTIKTNILKVIYKPGVVTNLEIQEAVAEAGHDTEKVKATEKNYKKLPSCCAYRDGVKVH